MSRSPVVWRQLTRNCWVATLPGGVTLSVDRNRSWRALRDPRPFKIEVLGNIWAQQHREGYATLDEAQRGAERVAESCGGS